MMTSNQDNIAKNWPEASQFKKSIRLEFSLYISGIILTLMLLTGYVVSTQYVKTVTQNILDKLLVQTRSYSEPAGKLIIAADGADALLLSNICKKLSNDNQDIYWAGITDKEGFFLAHTDIKQVVVAGRMRPVSTNESPITLRLGEEFDIRADTIHISVPIREGGVVVGKLTVAASTEPIHRARNASILLVAVITMVMILTGISITMVALRHKLRPISVITDHLKNIDFNNVSFNIPITSKNEFGYLAETIRVMGSKLNIAQKELIEKERMSRELEIAREIQANILPKASPSGAHFDLAVTYGSAKEVGGDYYDFIDFDEDQLGILVADVSGKSLPGMLVMLLTRDIIKQLTRSIRQPTELLAALNRELLVNIKKGMFVTMFFGILDKRTGKFCFASAGHNPLILLKRETGKAQLIKTKGFPLGMVDPVMFEKRIEGGEITLSGNDWLILYTDGINEAQNSLGEEFGIERLVASIESYQDLTPRRFVRELLGQHELFVGDAEQYDDITLLAIKWMGRSADIRTETTQKVANVD
jgi:serine phosphatase RsbU (regulator of sigma subunit)/uncharacterized protein (UPF0333 family)